MRSSIDINHHRFSPKVEELLILPQNQQRHDSLFGRMNGESIEIPSHEKFGVNFTSISHAFATRSKDTKSGKLDSPMNIGLIFSVLLKEKVLVEVNKESVRHSTCRLNIDFDSGGSDHTAKSKVKTKL